MLPALKVQKQCHTIVKDLALMIQTPLLVALNSSSYSFIAGIAKDPQDFVSCNFRTEHDGKFLTHTPKQIGSKIRGRLCCTAEVDDYYNVTEILKKLDSRSVLGENLSISTNASSTSGCTG